MAVLSKLAHGGLQEVAGVSRMFGSAGRMQKFEDSVEDGCYFTCSMRCKG